MWMNSSCYRKKKYFQKVLTLEKKVHLTQASQKFSNIFVHTSLWCLYRMSKVVQALEGTSCGIVILGALTHCASIQSVCNLKAEQMNMQCSLCVWIEPYHCGSKNPLLCKKDENRIDDSTVTWWFKKFLLRW